LNRLLRRSRRRAIKKVFSHIFGKKERSGPVSHLIAEQLETRLLLTTLTLPASATSDTVFVYADPEESEPGGEVAVFNEIRIGTLSGLSPIKDVAVEVLSFSGGDIPGILTVEGQSVSLGGGPAGAQVFQLIGDTQVNGIRALATNPNGETYGINQGGTLVKINTANAVATVIGLVSDTDNPLAQGNTVTFTNFEGADFDPVSGKLYAVAEGPTSFNIVGNPNDFGQVLITVDINTGEAEAVGRTSSGIADYSSSEIGDPALGTLITTIVYSQELGDNVANLGNSPQFIAFSAGGIDDLVLNEFVRISIVPVLNRVDVVTETIIVAPADSRIEGLMYSPDINGVIHLFGLNNGADEADPADNIFVEIDLGVADPADVFNDIIEYAELDLRGLSFDVNNEIGFATDATTGELYSVTTSILGPDDDGVLEIQGGVADVYLMYIASSTPDVFITMTSFTLEDPEEGFGDGNKIYQPQGGEPALIPVVNADGEDDEVPTPAEAGGVMIGTVPVVEDDGDDVTWRPMTFSNSNETSTGNPGPNGVFPGGFFRPGIVLANDEQGFPQDIGKIQVGGGVFGDVNINGSIDTFYAGYLGTNRFDVLGDIHSLVVATQSGGIEFGDDDIWQSPAGAILNVNGNMGSFYSNNDWGLPVRVHGRSVPAAPSFPGVLDFINSDFDTHIFVKGIREIERIGDDDDETTVFPLGGLDTIVLNNSPLTAQFLGSAEGTIRVFGQSEAHDLDTADYYTFGLLAGQSVSVSYFNTGTLNLANGQPLDPSSQTLIPDVFSVTGQMILFDPDLNVVGQWGEADIETGALLPITFTAENAGIYTVGLSVDFPDIELNIFRGYRLEITTDSQVSLGGGTVLTDIRDGNGSNSNITVTSGGLGGVSVNEVIRSATVNVIGSIGGIRAGVNGLPPGDLEAIAAPGGAPELAFQPETATLDDDDNTIFVTGVIPNISATGDIGRVSTPVDVNAAVHISSGGDFQNLVIGGDYAGQIRANENVGVIRIIGNFAPAVEIDDDVFLSVSPAGIYANADGIGAGGIIDAIVVGGNFGSSDSDDDDAAFIREIPVSTGPRGGNVRFVNIEGIIIVTNQSTNVGGFGPFIFEPGQSVIITDDSGTLSVISPGFVSSEVDDFLFGLPLDPPIWLLLNQAQLPH